MKNNIKILNLTIFFIINFFVLSIPTISKEINFKANEILSYEEGKIIVGKKNAEAVIDGEIEVYADKVTYNKNNETLIAEGNVSVIDLINGIKINSNKINYDKINNHFFSEKKTFFEIKDDYKIVSSELIIKLMKLKSFSETSVEDKIGNKINLISLNISTKLKLEWKRN